MLSVFLLCLLTGASWQDLKYGKVSNFWILSGIVVFFFLRFMVFIRGPSEVRGGFFTDSIVFMFRFVTVSAIFSVLFLFRMMGAGDIKVMALIGAYLGLLEGFLTIFYGLAASAAWSLLFMIHKKILIQRIQYFIRFMHRFFVTGDISAYYEKSTDSIQAGFALVPFLWLGLLIRLAEQGGV